MKKNVFLSGFLLLHFWAVSSYADTQLSLTLPEAIQLSIRNNPNVIHSALNEKLQKFNVWIQRWAFYPHYSLDATARLIKVGDETNHFHGSNSWDARPSVSWSSPIGTKVTFNATNAKTQFYNPGLSLEISQPLMRGFGSAIVKSALMDAEDAALIARLGNQEVLRNTITTLINAYLDMVMAERTIQIDKDALKRAQKSVDQTKLFIKAGHKAGTELITVEANVASANSQLENDYNLLTQSRYALLTAIGLNPNSPIQFSALDVDELIGKYQLPSLAMTKQWVLENDIQYLTDVITLHGATSRSFLNAKDDARWQLNLAMNASGGSGSGGGAYSGFNSIFLRATQYRSIALELTIPIDDQIKKQAVLNAQVALQQAELALKQERWQKETNAINSWHTVISAKKSLTYAEDADRLQEKTYALNFQKYIHGLIDSLELQSAQFQLIQTQQILLTTRIAYLKALVNFDALIGHTLKTWLINVRSS